MAGVDRLVPEAAPGQQRADRRALLVHDADLTGRGVRPQQVPLDVDVERVPQVARRVVRRDVQHLEVADVVLDLGALVHDEAELPEDVGDLRDRLVDRMAAATPDGPPGVVTSTASAASRVVSSEPRSSVPRSARAPSIAVRTLLAMAPDPRTVLGRQGADPAQDASQAPLLAEDVELERLERGDVRRGRDRGQRVRLERLEIAGQVGEIHGHSSG